MVLLKIQDLFNVINGNGVGHQAKKTFYGQENLSPSCSLLIRERHAQGIEA